MFFAFKLWCNRSGFPFKESKLSPPSLVVEFLGFVLDSSNMSLSLPPKKIKKMLCAIDSFLEVSTTSLKAIQSLGGLLNFAVVTMPFGRVFLARLYRLSAGMSKSSVRSIPAGVRDDMVVWRIFLSSFNGTFSIAPRKILPQTSLISDASGSNGWGLIFENHWTLGFLNHLR